MVQGTSLAALFNRADATALPALGGMARPDGVVIVSERFFAFAGRDGSLLEGEMPRLPGLADAFPLLRGIARLGMSVSPLLRRGGVAGRLERLVLLRGGACADRVRLPAQPCGAGRGNRDGHRPARLADARTDALPARRRAPGDCRGRARAARENVGRRGAAVPLLAALRDELRRARAADVAPRRPPVAVRARALDAGRRGGGLARADDGALAGRSGLDAAGCAGLPRSRARAAAADDTRAGDRRDAARR